MRLLLGTARLLGPFFAAALVLISACDDKGVGGRADLSNICARISACEIDGQHWGFDLMCTRMFFYGINPPDNRSTDTRQITAMLRCLRRAPDCSAMNDCVKATPSQAAVCEYGDGQYCVGNVLVRCNAAAGQSPSATDCSAAGLICGEGPTGADCGIAPCDPEVDQYDCDGDLFMDCNPNSAVWTVMDCSFSWFSHCNWVRCSNGIGGTCELTQPGWAECVGQGPDCDDDIFESYCDGHVMVSCRHGKVARFDCRDLHPETTCMVGGGIEPNEVHCRLGDECGWPRPESCADGIITYCLEGRLEQVDCRLYGYSGCDTENTADGPVVYCVQ